MKVCKAMISEKVIETWILGIILIVVLMSVLASLFPSLLTAGDSLQASGMPLGSLFQTGGAMWYIVGAGVAILLFRTFKSSK